MGLLIANTFTDSLVELTNDEQKAVKTTAFDLHINPANPGMKFHRIERARDSNFWSVRVNRDIRLIVHKTDSSLMLCYVDHHDEAYRWAERRKLEIHPKTGAAQLVEVRESVKEITVPVYVEEEQTPPPKPSLFAHVSDEDLLSYGVPADWLDEVRQANEDTILDLVDHLPSEAGEALLNLAVGQKPVVQPVGDEVDPFDHPDAQRRFRVMHDIEELRQALEYPWEKWTVFLHPAQRQVVEHDYNGPARVSGSAGTGKTVVAIHRAAYLARNNPNTRILLATFSTALANNLLIKLKRLLNREPLVEERIEVYAINTIAKRLYELNLGRPKIVTDEQIEKYIKKASQSADSHKFSMHFLISEWKEVVDDWQLKTWEDYRDVSRLGRKTRLPEKQRAFLWSIFEDVRKQLDKAGLMTLSDLYSQLTQYFEKNKKRPYDYVIIDEAQDINVSQLRFLASISSEQPNGLFFAGDLGQQIFQQPFSWKSLGVDVRGRSKTLKINYRTSHQIRIHADRLLEPEISDVDGNVESRKGTVSVFNGPVPTIMVMEDQADEIKQVSQWIKEKTKDGVKPHEIGVFVRTENEYDRAIKAINKAKSKHIILDETFESKKDHISLCTMHLAKGLEYKSVVVMACDDEIIPSQERIETITDNNDLEEVYNTERHLLYVACTRARDHLLVTSVAPASEFLDDLVEG